MMTEDNQGAQDASGVGLADCPDKPNCVCTVASREEQRMSPLRFDGEPESALATVEKLLSGMPRVAIVKRTNTYLQATFRSRIFRFVDDVEFAVDSEQNLLHFRSASRLGYSDLGANRSRMDELVQQLTKLKPFRPAGEPS